MIRVIYGSSSDWIYLRVSEVQAEYRAKGYEIRVLDGKTATEGEILTAFEAGLFDTEPVLVVIHNPTKLKKLSNLLDGSSYDVLVVQDNDRLPKALEPYSQLRLDQPKYDNEKRTWASKFLKDYLDKRGYKISDNLSSAVVKRVGVDLGVLRWEAEKYMVSLADKKEVTPDVVSGCISELSAVDGTDLVDTIASGDMKAFLKICTRIEKTSPSDQTMAVCNGLLLYNLIQWVEVGVRLAAKQTPTQIAEDLGKNPWFVENILAPRVKALGLLKIRKLLRHLYECEDGVRLGMREPWVKFKTGVVKVFCL